MCECKSVTKMGGVQKKQQSHVSSCVRPCLIAKKRPAKSNNRHQTQLPSQPLTHKIPQLRLDDSHTNTQINLPQTHKRTNTHLFHKLDTRKVHVVIPIC